VVVDQGGRYDDDDEHEGGRGPAFTPPPSRAPATMARRVASTTARRRSGLARWQRAASEIRLAAGGLDHGGTTSMAAGPDLAPRALIWVRQFFLFLKMGLFVSARNSQYLKVVIFSMIGINNMFTADTLDAFCSSDRLTAGD
jgi:hypothetical protein